MQKSKIFFIARGWLGKEKIKAMQKPPTLQKSRG